MATSTCDRLRLPILATHFTSPESTCPVRLRFDWLPALVLAASCSPGSSPVKVGSFELDPRATLFWSSGADARKTTRVVISDDADLCQGFESADLCDPGTRLGMPSSGRFLVLSVTGAEPGTYRVPEAASLSLYVKDDSEGPVVTASSGTVTLSAFKAGEGAQGRYSVALASGATLTGTFSADPCGSLDRLTFRVAQVPLSCSTSFLPTVCSTTCTCGARTLSADCSRTDSASSWSCTCNREGERSKCETAASSSNVCLDGNGCCSLRF
ncbi:MAG: hypothetical protein QM765_16325 [Myxococcales bacterium]